MSSALSGRSRPTRSRKIVESDTFHDSAGDDMESGNYEEDSLLMAEGGSKSTDIKPNWRRDKPSIFLLLFLYVLQGIPLGLAGSVPLILQQRKISYRQQATFSLVFWPFSLKLLWAPFVDGFYSSRLGRRKSWLVPVQYALAFVMLWLSSVVDSLLGGQEGQGRTPDILLLTGAFFILNFLAATQDIAVDGWALTMLSAENVGYASTCNTVGQTAGYFLANVVFLALESANFCNTYLRSAPQPDGIITLSSFLFFWGIVFLVTTTLVWLFKKEKPIGVESKGETSPGGIVSTYRQLWSIVSLRQVQSYLGFIIFCKIGMSAADSITGLKLVEYGVPKEKMAMLGVPVVPLQIILPLLISRYTAGPRPLDIWLLAYPVRLAFGIVFAGIVWWTQGMVAAYGSNLPMYYFGVIVMVYALHQVSVYSQFVAVMAWHARISDPKVGGTYMTLLNTITNLAGNWPSMIVLWFLDSVSTYQCQSKDPSNPMQACVLGDKQVCVAAGGDCKVDFEGYYVETAVCMIIGFVWFVTLGKKVQLLQAHPRSAWRL